MDEMPLATLEQCAAFLLERIEAAGHDTAAIARALAAVAQAECCGRAAGAFGAATGLVTSSTLLMG